MIGGYLVANLAVAAFLTAVLAGCIFRPPKIDRTIAVLLAAACLMAVLGPAIGRDEYFEWRNYWADIRVFLGMLGGVLWFRSRHPRVIFPVLMTLAAAILVELGATLVFLNAPIAGGSATERMSSPPMYYACTYLIGILPILNGYYREAGSQRRKRLILLLDLASAALVGYAAFKSSTRSVFLEIALLAVLCSMTLSGRVTKVLFVTSACIVLFFVSAGILSIQAASLSDSYLADRLLATDLRGELRYYELQMLFDHLRSDGVVGLGFGSLFWSPYLGRTLSLVTNPHIGAFTFLLKGGMLAFGVFIVFPSISCVRNIAGSVNHSIRFGAWGSVAMYMAIAGLSGGWDFYSLFSLGLAYSLATGREAGDSLSRSAMV
jgi:hypothetical protein